jgi:hypothetical protein
MQSVIINQFRGIGDIVFIQSIIQYFVKNKIPVTLPVEPIYVGIAKHFPDVNIINKNELDLDYNIKKQYEIDDITVIPMRFSDSICKVPYKDCMKSKYMLVGMDWRKWKDDCKIKRDFEAENNLFYKELGLTDGEAYTVVSENFTTGGLQKNNIKTNDGLKRVNVRFIQGYTIIDWLKVFQNATNIHAVSSSNIYLFELFEMNCKKIDLYARRPEEQNHDNYSYLLEKDYNFHL